MNIGIDMMGGDFAPLEAVKGVQQYLSSSENHLYCIGDEAQLNTLFNEYSVSSPFLHFIPSTEVIGYNEHPTKALKEKRIAGAGLDVYKDEPNIPNQLLELDNVVLLPHVASATHETRQAMSELVFENLDSYTKTGKVKVGVPGTVK